MNLLRIGQFEISRIADLDMPTSPRYLFPWISRDHLKPHLEWLYPHFYDPDMDGRQRFLFSIQTFVVRTPHHIILVDTCLGNDKKRENEFWNMRRSSYLDGLKKLGIGPEDVDFVMCTHLHTDHVGWNTRLVEGRWEPTFPKAKYIFNQREYDFWKDTREAEQAEVFRDSVLPVMESGQALLVKDDFEIVEGVQLEPTPGHTPGHSSLHLTSGEREGVITGDLLHHPVQFLVPEWCSVFDNDPEHAIRTRREFYARYAERDVPIIGTHFSAPTFGHITAHGAAWRLEVESGSG